MIVLSSGEYSLMKVSGSLPFCWFLHDEAVPVSPNQPCHLRARGYIYVSGHSTKEAAMTHGEKEGFVAVDPQGQL